MTRNYRHILRNRQLSRARLNYYIRRPSHTRDVVNTMIRGESIMRQARKLIDSMFAKSDRHVNNSQIGEMNKHVH